MNSQFCLPEDLWLQYIQEELGPLGQPENCSKIHWRAMKFLEGESVERFISKYTLLQTGHWAFQQTPGRFTSWGSSKALPVGPGGDGGSDERLGLSFLPVRTVPVDSSSRTSSFMYLQLFVLNRRSTDVEKSLTLSTSRWIYWHFVQKTNVAAVVLTLKQSFMESLTDGMILTETHPSESHHSTLTSSVCRHYQVYYFKKQVKQQW